MNKKMTKEQALQIIQRTDEQLKEGGCSFDDWRKDFVRFLESE